MSVFVRKRHNETINCVECDSEIQVDKFRKPRQACVNLQCDKCNTKIKVYYANQVSKEILSYGRID